MRTFDLPKTSRKEIDMTNTKPLVALFVAGALVGGCATPNTRGLGGGDYARAQARTAQAAEYGTVESIRAVSLDASTAGAGSAVAPALGALAGGALGSAIGKGDGQKIAAVLGALVGLEISVRTASRLLVVTQADEGIGFRAGDRVRLINDGRTWRVAPQ
jgi:outer membrane lipoprotein SlyB